MLRNRGAVFSAEAFSIGESFLHRTDPRVKIAGAVMFTLVAATAGSRHVLIAALAVSALAAVAARLHPWELLKRLLVVNVFILLLWVFLPFTYSGQAVASLGPLAVSREGIDLALAITLKCNAIVLVCVALLSTSPVVSLVHALHHFRVPDKLVHLMFFSYRYMHVIEKEYFRLRNAMRIRGFVPRSDIHTYRTIAYLVGSILVKSYDRSKRIYNAMVCRGFKGRFYLLYHFELTRRDVAVLFLVVVVSVCLVLFQWWPGMVL